MENLLESNERTLILFDAVCSGLSECLTLVHGDIRQMTEHRNKLVQLEQEQIQAKLIPAQELVVLTNNHKQYLNTNGNVDNNNQQPRGNRKKQSKFNNNDDDDPHHLAGLKLLDKRLADSFSHALSLNEIQKTSIAAKQHVNHSKPSIFQVLLGKSGKNNDPGDVKKKKNNNHGYDGDDGLPRPGDKIDNRMVIDDINRQTRLAMQYSKQLEAQLLKVEDLRGRYEMHLKMGLVVRSVSRAYLANGSSSNANSPGSLARRHCSSLVINDSSSIGTHSSLSSLNLSTWSSSRSKQRAAAAAANNNNNSSQMFVSTLSLNNKQNKRINLAKLISSSTNKSQQDPSSHYDDPQMNMSSTKQRRISSHSIEQPNRNSYSTYNDWTIPESSATYAHFNKSGTLSKSNNNLNSSHLSLKGRKSKQTAVSKTTIKEFIDNIDKIETEFESYMGTFLLVVEDIQGFARVCQGDVFEITIKYGDAQKFKSKISVLKDNKQKCDNRQTFFKARIADILAIKAYECKGLGKRVLLGHKLCETRDLFTARSQLMTISLNQTGSIKLNLVVTWNPLHMAPNSSSALPGVDISHISLPPTPVSSTLSSLSSVPSLNGTTTSISIQSQHRGKSMNSSSSIEIQEPQQEAMYQPVDPTYGYYIPPPDYITNELNH